MSLTHEAQDESLPHWGAKGLRNPTDLPPGPKCVSWEQSWDLDHHRLTDLWTKKPYTLVLSSDFSLFMKVIPHPKHKSYISFSVIGSCIN